MKYFDAHNHLNADPFRDTWQAVAQEAAEAGIVGMINNAGDLPSAAWGIEQAEQLDGVYATVGIHPEDFPLKKPLDVLLGEMENLISSSDKVVAIGELGLDTTLDEVEASMDKQIELISHQLAMAERLQLPVVLHVRDKKGETVCFDTIFTLLEQYKLVGGQFHCWTGSVEQAKKALAFENFYISFSGILTYKSSGEIADAAKVVPDNRLLVETDGPYLIPEPQRTLMSRQSWPSDKRLCLPVYVTMTAEKLAELRDSTVEKIAQITRANAERLFLDNQK